MDWQITFILLFGLFCLLVGIKTLKNKTYYVRNFHAFLDPFALRTIKGKLAIFTGLVLIALGIIILVSPLLAIIHLP